MKKQAAFWPVIGVLGLRQVGKTTLFGDLSVHGTYLSMDDEDVRSEAEASAKSFLGRNKPPIVIDEVQKVPELFDAVKSAVDRNRIPGSYYLTGSSAFSAQKNIKESLTGRIGLHELFPMTLAEADEMELDDRRVKPLHRIPSRFNIERLSAQLKQGGLPVPMFSRDASIRTQYWKNWIATTLGRDLARVYGKGFDADFADKILFELIRLHEDGIFPTLANFKSDSRKTKRYLNAFRNIFVVRMLPCHEAGTGRDIYFLSDSGMASSLLKKTAGDSVISTLTRIYILNEVFARSHYSGATSRWSYFKSRKGTPVDLIWDDVPIKIVTSLQQTGWEERALEGAMKAIHSKQGILVGPTDRAIFEKRGKISLVPWTHWS